MTKEKNNHFALQCPKETHLNSGDVPPPVLLSEEPAVAKNQNVYDAVKREENGDAHQPY